MKSVLISTQPKWCELIASGKKTDEVRKTKPKLEPPFRCYIYCTNGQEMLWILNGIERAYNREKIADIFRAKDVGGAYRANGKVIGEFVCNRFTFLDAYYDTNGNRHLCNTNFIKSCVPDDELFDYLYGKHGEKHGGWAWHISDLVIYEKPKELWEFAKPDKCPYNSPIGCTYGGHCYRAGQTKRCGDYMERPPQSWCYVEGGE